MRRRGVTFTCEHKVIECVVCAPPCVRRSEVQVPFALTNNSPFDVSYCVELASVGEANASGMQPFDCVPMEALVGAGQTRDLKLTLSADTVSLYYAANLRIVVPNQKEKMEWRVQGRCWAQAMFVFDASPEALAAPPDVNRFKDQGLAAPDAIVLEKTFPQTAAERNEPVEHQLMVGNCGSGGTGDFSFDNAAAAAELGFKVEPASGKVDASSKVPVIVTYTPPPGGPLALWNEIKLTGTLRGGTPAEAVTVEVRLRGFVPAQL